MLRNVKYPGARSSPQPRPWYLVLMFFLGFAFLLVSAIFLLAGKVETSTQQTTFGTVDAIGAGLMLVSTLLVFNRKLLPSPVQRATSSFKGNRIKPSTGGGTSAMQGGPKSQGGVGDVSVLFWVDAQIEKNKELEGTIENQEVIINELRGGGADGEMNKLKKEIADLKAALEKEKAKSAKLAKDVEEAKNHTKKEVERVTKEHTIQLDKKDSEITSLHKSRKQKDTTIKEQADEIDALKRNAADPHEIVKVRKERDSFKEKHASIARESDDLRGQLKRMSTDLAQTRDEAKRIKDEHIEKTAALHLATKQLAKLKSRAKLRRKLEEYALQRLPKIAPQVGVRVNAGPPNGAKVVDVTDTGTGAAGGIQKGDILEQLNGDPTPDNSTFKKAVKSCLPGDTVAVQVQRGRERLTLMIDIGGKGESVEFCKDLRRWYEGHVDDEDLAKHKDSELVRELSKESL